MIAHSFMHFGNMASKSTSFVKYFATKLAFELMITCYWIFIIVLILYIDHIVILLENTFQLISLLFLVLVDDFLQSKRIEIKRFVSLLSKLELNDTFCNDHQLLADEIIDFLSVMVFLYFFSFVDFLIIVLLSNLFHLV